MIGVRTPEFTLSRNTNPMSSAAFGSSVSLTPFVIDSNHEIWKGFANRYWPTKCLLDKDGYLRYGHFGEGRIRSPNK